MSILDSEYYCPHCGAILNDQLGFDPNGDTWKCTECGQYLYSDCIYNGNRFPGVMWYCDECGALLNKQGGFNDSCAVWKCTECGHLNKISENEIVDSHKDNETQKMVSIQDNQSEDDYCYNDDEDDVDNDDSYNYDDDTVDTIDSYSFDDTDDNNDSYNYGDDTVDTIDSYSYDDTDDNDDSYNYDDDTVDINDQGDNVVEDVDESSYCLSSYNSIYSKSTSSYSYAHHWMCKFGLKLFCILLYLITLAGGLYSIFISVYESFDVDIGINTFRLILGGILLWGSHLIRVKTFDADDFSELGVEFGAILMDLGMKTSGLALFCLRLPVFHDLSWLIKLAIGLSIMVGGHFARRACSNLSVKRYCGL